MARKRTAAEPRPTIRRVPVELWEFMAPILRWYDPPARTGRRRIDAKAALEATIFRMRTGCQWNHRPEVYHGVASQIIQRPHTRDAQAGVVAAANQEVGPMP